jgi:hypothetical protein
MIKLVTLGLAAMAGMKGSSSFNNRIVATLRQPA